MRAFFVAVLVLAVGVVLAPERADAQQNSRPSYYTPSNYGTPNGSHYKPSNYGTQPARYGMPTYRPQFNPAIYGATNAATPIPVGPAPGWNGPPVMADQGSLPSDTSGAGNPAPTPAGTLTEGLAPAGYSVMSLAGIANANIYTAPSSTLGPTTLSGYGATTRATGARGYGSLSTAPQYPAEFSSALRRVYPNQGY